MGRVVDNEKLLAIKQTLAGLGLVESEIEIFFLWLEMGSASIKQLTDESKMGRVTVH